MKMYCDDNIEFVIAKYKDGLSTRKISEISGISKTTITKWISNAGISRTNSEARGGGINVENKAIELYRTGIGCNEIAKQLGITPTTVYKWLNKSDIKIRTLSEAQSLRSEQGRQPIRGVRSIVKTKFGNIRADSVYEAARILQLENNCDIVNIYRYKGSIDYGLNKKYSPDLVVEYISGLKIVEEIKPLFQINRDDVIEKAVAARLILGEDILYQFITQNDIDFNIPLNDKLIFSSINDANRFKRALKTAKSQSKNKYKYENN